MSRAGPRPLTVGSATASAGQLLAALSDSGVRLLVGVRRVPGGRTSPHLGQDRPRTPAAGARTTADGRVVWDGPGDEPSSSPTRAHGRCRGGNGG